MNRAIVNVATGHYVKGLRRLLDSFAGVGACTFADMLPPGSPSHEDVPYAFKAYALKYAEQSGAETLLWCDACIVPGPRPLSDLLEKIERDGYWIARNGWTNYQWTADSAYVDLFATGHASRETLQDGIDVLRGVNRDIPHVVATAFGISLKHPIGRAILDEYYRLASETKAFCGPWQNANYLGDGWPYAENPPHLMPCGPPDVRGHRHDQTALSVIAWRLGCVLSDCPEWFSYCGGETDKTVLVADGGY